MDRGIRRRIIWTTALVAGAVALMIFYAMVDPSTSRYVPRCLFHALTGLECPGCGSQRALHALLTGDLFGAWRYNALVVAGIIPVGLYLYAELTRLRHPGLYKLLNSMPAIIIAGIVIVAWGIVRNII